MENYGYVYIFKDRIVGYGRDVESAQASISKKDIDFSAFKLHRCTRDIGYIYGKGEIFPIPYKIKNEIVTLDEDAYNTLMGKDRI